ncbi:TPA: hypothetical protein ACX6QP_002143 [Photobacterium damselae]
MSNLSKQSASGRSVGIEEHCRKKIIQDSLNSLTLNLSAGSIHAKGVACNKGDTARPMSRSSLSKSLRVFTDAFHAALRES